VTRALGARARTKATSLRAPRRLARLARTAPAAADAIDRVRAEHLTYLELAALLDLAEAVVELERQETPGCLIEAGSAYGGSAIVLAAAKSRARPLRVYDVFGAFPSPSERDADDARARFAQIDAGAATWTGERPFYSYVDDLLADVRSSFERHGYEPRAHEVELVQGLIEETLQVDGPVALAHVDCDWYDPVLACLQRIAPQLVPGGRIVLDDYDDWQGARQAVEDHLADDDSLSRSRHARLHLVKRG
jgi:SAM-dependent methyltransferase